MNFNIEEIIQAAIDDVSAGVSLTAGARNVVLSQLGPRPRELDPADPRVVRAQETIANRSIVLELEADILAHRQNLPPYHGVIVPAVIALTAIEIAGNFDLIRVIDLPMVTQVIVSLAAAAFVVIASAIASDAVADLRNNPKDAAQRRWGRVILGGYCVLVAAVAILRLSQAGDADDGSVAERVASALVLATSTLGPAFMIKAAAKEWQSTRLTKLSHESSVRRHGETVRALTAADHLLDALHGAPSTWDADAARIVAVYERAHQVALTRKQS